MKIHFNYGTGLKDGLTSTKPGTTAVIADGVVEEITGDYVLEKVPDLVEFIKECYRLLPTGGKASFTAHYYAGVNAWASPLNRRGISETSLNFASKDWRTANNFTDVIFDVDFEVVGNFATDASIASRADEVKNFWLNKYLNVVQLVVFNLTKK